MGRGWRVESQTTPGQVVMVLGRRPNHILHLLLSVVTMGLWLPIWLLVAVSTKETRAVLTVLPDGRVANSLTPLAGTSTAPKQWYQDSTTVLILGGVAVVILTLMYAAG